MRISDWSSDVCSSDLQVEYGGALLLALVPFVERAEQAIPKEVGDPVIALFVMEMVSHVPRLHRRQEFALRLVGQMLDAVAEFIKAGRSEERRVGKEGVSTGRSRWSPYH